MDLGLKPSLVPLIVLNPQFHLIYVFRLVKKNAGRTFLLEPNQLENQDCVFLQGKKVAFEKESAVISP